MSRRTRSNPDWSDAIAKKNCAAIQKACKDFDLPPPLLDDGCRIEGELGAGLYGAVYKTESKDVVFKISSDPSEAHLIAILIALRQKGEYDSTGIVRFDAIFALNERYIDNSTFVIWREAAQSTELRVFDSSTCEIKEFAKNIIAYKSVADEVFSIALSAAKSMPLNDYWAWMKDGVDAANEILDGNKMDIPLIVPKFIRYLAKSYELADKMERNTKSFFVGNALKTLLRSGLLIGDTHVGNIGVVSMGKCGQGVFKIFDVGHACVLRKKYSEIEIPVLGGIE